jgi:DNA (cytosine-5)-methyltransferase 1
MHKKYTFVDLFAGCGGLSLGLELAGFTPLLVNELSPDAMETYLRNRDADHPYLRDGYNIHDAKELLADGASRLKEFARGFEVDFGVGHGDLDLLVGGPPCQGYSGIGHRRSYAVDKAQLPSNFLYQDMAGVVHRLKPKMFLFENVRGLLSARWTKDGAKGEIWNDVLNTFTSIPDYSVRYKLVHAKDYGVPQNRPRVLLVGVRNDLRIELDPEAPAGGYLPVQTNDPPDIQDLLGDLVDPEYKNGQRRTELYPSIAGTPIQRWFRTPREGGRVFGRGAQVSEQEYSVHADRIVEKFSHMLQHGGEIPEGMRTAKFAQRVLPATWDSRGPSITATSLPEDYVHFSQPRVPTVREWARIQTFPDWYSFAGKRTTGGIRRAGNPTCGVFEREVPKYTQIGNAVPVLLARAVGHNFAKILSSVVK